MDFKTVIPWIAVLFVVILWIGYTYGNKRKAGFKKFARQKGLSFSNRADKNVEDQINDFELFSNDAQKTISNVIRGNVDGINIMIFDYRTKPAQGESIPSDSQTIAILRSQRINLPSFALYPKTVLNSMFNKPGNQNIDLVSRNKFLKDYILRGDDENAVRNAFTDQVCSYFEVHKGLKVEGRGNRLLYYRYGIFAKPDELHAFLLEGVELLKLFEK